MTKDADHVGMANLFQRQYLLLKSPEHPIFVHQLLTEDFDRTRKAGLLEVLSLRNGGETSSGEDGTNLETGVQHGTSKLPNLWRQCGQTPFSKQWKSLARSFSAFLVPGVGSCGSKASGKCEAEDRRP